MILFLLSSILWLIIWFYLQSRLTITQQIVLIRYSDTSRFFCFTWLVLNLLVIDMGNLTLSDVDHVLKLRLHNNFLLYLTHILLTLCSLSRVFHIYVLLIIFIWHLPFVISQFWRVFFTQLLHLGIFDRSIIKQFITHLHIIVLFIIAELIPQILYWIHLFILTLSLQVISIFAFYLLVIVSINSILQICIDVLRIDYLFSNCVCLLFPTILIQTFQVLCFPICLVWGLVFAAK